jgi:hypothetical protein
MQVANMGPVGSRDSFERASHPRQEGVLIMLSETIDIDGIKIFYREAGDPSLPKLVLLHGFLRRRTNIAI